MVKIEKLSSDGKVTVIRDGKEVQVFEKQQFPLFELDSLKVHSGTVVYSINEEEIVEKSAPAPVVEAPAPVPKPVAKVVAKK